MSAEALAGPEVPAELPALLEDASAGFAPERTRDKLARFALDGARLLAVAAAKVTSRTVWWGGWGALVGLVAFIGLAWTGLLTFPWPAAQVWILVLLGLLYPIAGAGCWGHAGFWRGVGRFAIVVGVERGWVVTLLAAVFDRITATLRRSGRVDRAMGAAEAWAADLPLARWEGLLEDASARVIGGTGPDDRGLMRFLRRFVVSRIHKLTLRIVRAELENGRGGGVSMARVREVAFLTVEDKFRESVVGLMNQQLLAMTGLFLALGALPPVLAWLIPLVIRWWTA